MLGQLSGWDDDLGAGNVVVWQEDHLQEIADLVVAVYLLGNGSDQLDESLGVVVTWSGLTTDADNSWDEAVLSLVGWGVEDGKISMDDVEDVHKLSLVLMYSLNLDIEHDVLSARDIVAGPFLNPSGELALVLLLDSDELVLELSVGSVWHQLSQVVESGDPLVDTTEGVTDELGELWVAAMDPSSWGNTVGLVLELAWVELIELTEDSLLEEFRVEGGDTVDGVGADDGEVSHSDFLWPSFLDQGHSLDLVTVTWVLLGQLGDVDMVDQIDELKMSWQQSSNKFNGPFLECLWQNGMVGVGEGVVNNVPCFLEGEVLLIDQDSEQFDGSNNWMGIVELDLVQIGEGGESIVTMLDFISSDNVINRG